MKELDPQGIAFAFNALHSLENMFSTQLCVVGVRELWAEQMESHDLEDVRLQRWSSYVQKLTSLKEITQSIFYYPAALFTYIGPRILQFLLC